MNLLIYENVQPIHIRKANVINTINVTKGFILNNCNIFFNVSHYKNTNFFKNNFKNDNSNIKFLVGKTNNELLEFINNNIDIIYSRDLEFPLFLIKNKINKYIILEDHGDNIPNYIETLRNYDKLIFNTISPIIIKKFNIKKSLLFPCSIDFNYFSQFDNFNHNLYIKNKINIVYCGHLYDYKGIPLILKGADKLENILFHLVGGKERDINNLKNSYVPKNVIIHGYKNYKDVPNYLYSADMLIIPYSKNGNIYSKSQITSPIKLFEYLSTKKPVLCSNIDGIKNWVTDNEVTFYKADDINDFIKKINYLIENKNSEHIINKIKNGFIKAEKYSTFNKCKKLLSLCK